MAEIEKFKEPKPRIPLRTDARFKKLLNVDESSDDFSQKFNQKLDAADSFKDNRSQSLAQEFANKEIQKTVSGFSNAFKHLSREQRLDILLVDKSHNFEKVNAKSHIKKNELITMLPGEKIAQEASAVYNKKKKIKKDTETEAATNSDGEKEVEGKGYTYYYNVDAFLEVHENNVIEKDDHKNYQRFAKEHPELLKAFGPSLKGIEGLEPGIGAKKDSVLDGIMRRHQDLTITVDNFYKENKVDNSTLNFGFDEIRRMPEIYRGLSDAENFMLVLQGADSTARFRDTFSSLFGNGSAPNIQALLKGDKTAGITEDQSKLAQESAKKWIASVAENADDAVELLSVSAMTYLRGSFSEKMDWGKLDISDAETLEYGDSRNSMVRGFLNHLKTDYMGKYQSDKVVTLQDFTLDSAEEAKKAYQRLQEKGVIDADGKVTNRFNMDNPDFVLGLDLNAKESEAQIRQTLREKVLGNFSWETQDQLEIAGKRRRNIKIGDPQSGETKKLTQLLDEIGNGESWQDMLKNSTDVYHKLLDIYTTMTGADADLKTDGKVKITDSTDTTVAVKISENATWQQWNPEAGVAVNDLGFKINVGEWETVEKQPLHLHFKDQSTAQQFADDLFALIQTLGTLSTAFAPQDTLSLIQDKQNPNLLQIIKSNRFDANIYDEAVDTIRKDVESKLGKEGFKKGLINFMGSKRFRTQKRQWSEREEEHYDNELQRIMAEVKAQAKNKAEIKKAYKQQLMQIKRAEKEARKAEKVAQNNRNKSKTQTLKNKKGSK